MNSRERGIVRLVAVLFWLKAKPLIGGQGLTINPCHLNPVQEVNDGSLTRLLTHGPGVERKGLGAPTPPRLKCLKGRFQLFRCHQRWIQLHAVTPGHWNRPITTEIVANALLQCSTRVNLIGADQPLQRFNLGHAWKQWLHKVNVVKRHQRRHWVCCQKTIRISPYINLYFSTLNLLRLFFASDNSNLRFRN